MVSSELAVPHESGQVSSCCRGTLRVLRIPGLAVGSDAVPSTVRAPGLVSSDSIRRFFLQPWVVSSHTCVCTHTCAHSTELTAVPQTTAAPLTLPSSTQAVPWWTWAPPSSWASQGQC